MMLMMSLVAFNEHLVLPCAWHKTKLCIQLSNYIHIVGSVQWVIFCGNWFDVQIRIQTHHTQINYVWTISGLYQKYGIEQNYKMLSSIYKIQLHTQRISTGNAISLCGCHSNAKNALNVTQEKITWKTELSRSAQDYNKPTLFNSQRITTNNNDTIIKKNTTKDPLPFDMPAIL